MEWFSYQPEYGLWGLAAYSFLAATLLPGGSEVALFALIDHHPTLLWPALAVATLGNSAGGMVSWWCGRAMPSGKVGTRLQSLQHQLTLRRWGSPALLLSWVPIVGDALCMAAGWLRLHWLPCLAFMAVGKFARYALIAGAASL